MTALTNLREFAWTIPLIGAIVTYAIVPVLRRKLLPATHGAWWAKTLVGIFPYLMGCLFAAAYVYFFVPCQ